MPFLIRSKGAPAGEVVSDRDKELLGMWNCLNPGIRGLFDVPESNFMKVFILASACFCFYCTLIDFTVAVCAPDIFEAMEPMDRGTFKELIYCFDVVFMVELAISICVKVHKSGGPTRSTVLIVIEVISAIPYELMYVILKGKSHHVFYTFRMRYSLRFLRFFMESAGENFDLSLLLLKYMFASSIMCVVVCSIRIYYWCHSYRDAAPELIDCDALDFFAFTFTYTVLNGQLTYSSPIFTGKYKLTIFDAFFHLLAFLFTFMVVPKGICMYLEQLGPRYDFATQCSVVLHQMQAIHKKNQLKDHRLTQSAKNYMADWWRASSYAWRADDDDFQVGIMPEAIKAEITIDVRWNMFKHSVLFRNESVAFLKALALKTTYCFGTEGDQISDFLEHQTAMIYIVSGSVCLICEEDQLAPVISLTGGTVLGEINLFICASSKTKIRCRTYCEYIKLTLDDFLSMRATYRSVYDRLRQQMFRRIRDAKRFQYVCRRLEKRSKYKTPKSIMSLRYIKYEIRKLTDPVRTAREERISAIYDNDNRREEIEEQEETAAFDATYLRMYVMSETQGFAAKPHILTSGNNFKFHPDSNLVSFWVFFINALIVMFDFAYPLGLQSEEPLYTSVYDYFACVISVCFLMDFWSFNYVAVKRDNKLLVSSFELLINRFNSIEAAVDAFASLPISIILNLMQGPLDYHTHRVLSANFLLKTYKLERYVKGRLVYHTYQLLLFEVVKMVYLLGFLILFSYAIFNHYGYFKKFPDVPQEISSRFAIVVQFLVSSSEAQFVIDNECNLLPMILLQYMAFFIIHMLFCLAPAAASLAHAQVVHFENMVEDFTRLYTLYNFKGVARRKLNRFLHFHYDQQEKQLLMGVGHTRKMLGTNLYKMKRMLQMQKLFQMQGLLRLLPVEVQGEIGEIGDVVFIPRGELIIVSGSPVKEMYILMKGHCATIIPPTNEVETSQRPGDALMMIEALYGLPALHNIVAVTDTQLWRLPVGALNRKLIMFPEQHRIIYDCLRDCVSVQSIASLKRDEIEVVDEKGSLISIDASFKTPKQQKYKLAYWMIRPISPGGTFWFTWELVHLFVVYWYALLGTIPIFYEISVLEYSFWIFRVFDLVIIADMYFKHFLIYYNEWGIEVDNPFMTCRHYWNTGLTLDILTIIPLEMLLPLLGTTRVSAVVWVRINKYIPLYRVFGIRKYLNGYYMWEFRSSITLYSMATILLVVNFLQIALLYWGDHCTITARLGQSFENICNMRDDQFWIDYLWYFKAMLAQFFNMGLYEARIDTNYLFHDSLLSLLGLVGGIAVTSVLAAFSLFRNAHLTTYQIKMQRLVRFLNLRNVDRNIRLELIKHFEYLWARREGKILNHLLQKFSRCCYEETMYAYFARHIEQTVLFSGFSKVIVKELICSQKVQRLFILRRGIILHVNDINPSIYIVQKGSVEVLGPDLTFIRRLHTGSIFGCLDDVAMQRTTLMYVAQTHCELLVMRAVDFHTIVKKFPRFGRHYRSLWRGSNNDYISGFSSSATSSTVSNVDLGPKSFETRKKWFPVLQHSNKRIKFFVIYCFVAFMFECVQLNIDRSNLVISIAYLMDLVFWIKIYLDFSTAFEDFHGFSITKRKLIAKRYIRHKLGFVFHLACNLPLEVISLSSADEMEGAELWKLLRCNRLLKLILVFRYMRWARNRLNVNVILIRGLFILLVVCAVQQISMVLMAYSMTVFFTDRQYWGPFLAHTYSLSGRLYTPFGLDFPVENLKIYNYVTVLTLVLTVARMTWYYVVTEGVATYQVLFYERNRYANYMRNLRSKLTDKDVSAPLKERVLSHCSKQSLVTANAQFPYFLKEAPYYLKQALLDSMFGYHLRKHPVLKRCHVDLLRQLAASFETEYFFRDDYVAFVGDIDGKMYFLDEGELEGVLEDTLIYEVNDSRYVKGDWFGYEQIVQENVGHKRTYKVTSDRALLVYLKRDHFWRLLNFFPASKFLIDTIFVDELAGAAVEYRDYAVYTHHVHS